MNKEMPASDLIILDDAYQHRSLAPSVSILLIDFNRPVAKDHLLPLGRLRDLPERVGAADIVIISKCPKDIDPWQRSRWAEAIGLTGYDGTKGYGLRKDGSIQHLFFTTIGYDTPMAVFPEGDARYVYSKKLILFSGIANDKPLRHYLSSSYKLLRHFEFSDHHRFSRNDMTGLIRESKAFPTSVVMTTEKDCQRVRDCDGLPDNFRQRLFYTPIKSEFISKDDHRLFVEALTSFLK